MHPCDVVEPGNTGEAASNKQRINVPSELIYIIILDFSPL